MSRRNEIHNTDISSNSKKKKEGNVLFNDTLSTFYLWLYGIRRYSMTQIA